MYIAKIFTFEFNDGFIKKIRRSLYRDPYVLLFALGVTELIVFVSLKRYFKNLFVHKLLSFFNFTNSVMVLRLFLLSLIISQ